ncbi:ABC-type antimicrobial peptide transport system, permease component [Synechococcus sp. PCC 7502]|uniref:FtsX-like permease family protein n=1 Tax=Synechococcus sp. PCC 7502 TaxID=1173263 RepID=UPI00029FBCC0|nr:FtsX-like permease family protein [Synechococcus sp. PCC 7502]AFY74502.1 ABC-type antimicrobial peptide transport system, permease component [Synechococcus sp. PCC 7502]
MIFAVPLAWFQLTYEKGRLLVAIAGIMFAVILIFMQLGFQDALFTSAVRLHTNLRTDVAIISPQSTNLVGMRNFSQRRLYQAFGYKGVESIHELYIGLAAWKVKNDPAGQTRNILVLGADPDSKIFKMPGANENLAKTKVEDVILFDRSSRSEFGPIVQECGVSKELATKYIPAGFACNNFVTREVANRTITVGGLFELGSSFAADGTIITSQTNFLRIFDNRQAGLINVGLINLKPDASPYEMILDYVQSFPNKEVILPTVPGITVDGDRVRYADPDKKDRLIIDKYRLTLEDIEKSKSVAIDDIKILTRAGFIDFERSYWQKSTSIGFIFSLGTVMGFIVGIVIVYQILYTDVSDHMAEYATLKAMGYSNWYLAFVVIQEAFVLSILGYIPGFFACLGLYSLTKNATRLPLDMTIERGIQVMILTVLMCVISGAISLRKVQSADPAEIFG